MMKLKKKKILVTGSSGFVGSHLIKNLRDKYEVVEYDIKEGRDILNEKLLHKLVKGADAVVHLAALVSGPDSWERPGEYFRTNGLGTLNVFLAAIKSGTGRIIHTSSAAIYGNPLTPYGASKQSGESVAEVYKGQIETVVLRPSNIYGPDQNPAYGYAIHNFITGIKGRGEVEIFGDGKQTRDFINIEDVIDVIRHFLISPVPEKPVDVGTGKEIEIKELAVIIGKLLKKNFKVKYLPARKELYKSRADTSVLEECGINPKNFHSLEDGLKKLFKISEQ